MKFITFLLFVVAINSAFALENVFKNDTRVKVTARTQPWLLVAKLITPTNAWCTAELVSRDLVVTAAHCVVDPKTKEIRKGDYKVVFGLIDNKYTALTGVTHFWIGTGDPAGHRGQDWALLRLAEPLGDTYGWFGVQQYSPAAHLNDSSLTLTGFSGDFEHASSASTESGCSFTRFYSLGGVALHNCDSSRGSSGGPIYLRTLDNAGQLHYDIVALNVAEYRGGDTSRVGIDYTDSVANVAIPAGTTFLKTLNEIK